MLVVLHSGISLNASSAVMLLRYNVQPEALSPQEVDRQVTLVLFTEIHSCLPRPHNKLLDPHAHRAIYRRLRCTS